MSESPINKCGLLTLEIAAGLYSYGSYVTPGKKVTKTAAQRWIVLEAGKLTHFVSEQKYEDSLKKKPTKRFSIGGHKVESLKLTAATKLGTFQSDRQSVEASVFLFTVSALVTWFLSR